MAIYRQRVCRSLKVYYASILHLSELLTRLGLLRFALPRGAMRIKESPMVRSKRTTFHFVYRVYYASILHTIYKIKDATISGGIIVASFALQSC